MTGQAVTCVVFRRHLFPSKTERADTHCWHADAWTWRLYSDSESVTTDRNIDLLAQFQSQTQKVQIKWRD